MAENPPKRRRRFLQFSLRTLLVFVLIVSIGMSWLAVKMEKAREQREAVEAIEKAGGEVFYDEEGHGSLESSPKWARAFVGDDFILDAVWVRGNGNVDDDEANHLKALTHLTTLYLSNTQITDSGLEHLEGLTNLRSLDLQDTQVTLEGVEKLKEALPDCEVAY